MQYLETHTGFSRDVRRIIQRATGWPQRWMTAEEVEWELRLRDFWSCGRQAVHPEARVGLVRLYLRQKIATAVPGSALGWVQSGDRYLYRDGMVRSPRQPAATAAERGERRRFQRVGTDAELLRCQYGRVVNLSLGGAQVVATGQPSLQAGARAALDLAWVDEPAMRLQARVVWINEGPDGWVLGVEFRGLGPAETTWLRETIRRATASLAATV